jgi:hypothetical protein
MVEFAADMALALLALAAAAWVLLFDVLCVGSCTNTPEAGLVSWLVIAAAVAGAVLLLVARRRLPGRALLAGAIVLAAAVTLAG